MLMKRALIHLVLACAALIWTHSQAAAQTPKNSDKALPQPSRLVPYKQIGDKSLNLHVFDRPKSTDSTSAQTKPDKTAAIVFFFGGGWTNGSPSQFYPQAKHLSDLGILAACAEYRVRSRDGAAVVDCTADAQDAIAYLRDHAAEWNIDPGQIVAAGGSAGGHLAAACATVSYRGSEKREPDAFRPNALVLFNPAVVLGATDKIELSAKEKAQLTSLTARMGDEPVKLSPYHQLSKSLPPTLIMHGKADTTVPYKTVELFTAKAKELGCDCQLVGYAGQQHGFFNYSRSQDNYEATRDEMVRFLRRLGYLPKS